MRKRIVIIVSHPYREDPQLRKEARTLVGAGFNVRVIAWDRKRVGAKRQHVEGVEVVDIRLQGTFGVGGYLHGLKTLWYWVLAMRQLLANRDWDAVHCQDLNTLLPGYLAGQFAKKPVVFDAHDPYPEMLELAQPGLIHWALRTLEAFLCRRVDYIITVNQLMAQRFRSLTSRPIQIVYNYPEKSLFRAEESVPRPKGRFVVGRIGSIQPGTGLEETIEAIGKIQNGCQIKLLLVGRVASAYRDEFQKLSAPLAEQVELTGFVDPQAVVDYYRRMDLSVMLYRPTPIFRYLSPMKLFESMAMGVPVVASDIGEVRKVVEAYHCGVVLRGFDSDELARVIEKLMSNPELRRRMGANGIKAVQEELNWEKESQKLVGFYKSLLSRPDKAIDFGHAQGGLLRAIERERA